MDIQSITAMLRQAGLPLTTDNLNRASYALARGEQLGQVPVDTPSVAQNIDRTVTRSMPVPPIPPDQQMVTSPNQDYGVAGDYEQLPNAEASITTEPNRLNASIPPEDIGIPSRVQRRGTLHKPQYVGDTGPAQDAVPGDVNLSDVGTILMMSPWLGMGAGVGAGNVLNRVMQPRNVMPSGRGAMSTPTRMTVPPAQNTASIEMLPQGSMKPVAEIQAPNGPRVRGEAVDDFIRGGDGPVITRSNASDMKPVATIEGKPAPRRNNRVGGSTSKAPVADEAPITMTILKEFMKKQKYGKTTKSE